MKKGATGQDDQGSSAWEEKHASSMEFTGAPGFPNLLGFPCASFQDKNKEKEAL